MSMIHHPDPGIGNGKVPDIGVPLRKVKLADAIRKGW